LCNCNKNNLNNSFWIVTEMGNEITVIVTVTEISLYYRTQIVLLTSYGFVRYAVTYSQMLFSHCNITY